MTAMLSKMKVTGFFTNITSDRPNDLYNFYRDVVALPAAPEYRRP